MELGKKGLCCITKLCCAVGGKEESVCGEAADTDSCGIIH